MMYFAGFITSTLALFGVIPFELRWLIALSAPDIIRVLFKLNVQTILLLPKELDYIVPFISLVGATTCLAASFHFDAAVCLLCFILVCQYTVEVLFGECEGRQAPNPVQSWPLPSFWG